MQTFETNRLFHGIGDHIAETLWELGLMESTWGERVNAEDTAMD